MSDATGFGSAVLELGPAPLDDEPSPLVEPLVPHKVSRTRFMVWKKSEINPVFLVYVEPC